MSAHALQFPSAAPHLRLVVSRPATVWPAAPTLALAEPAMSTTMKRCLLLALLLHVWLVLMLGSAPGGTAAPGQGVAGTLNITLQGPETRGATEVTAPPVAAPPEGASGKAAQPRWGGVVREQAEAQPPTPGAAQLGRWSATPQPADTPELPAPPPGRVVDEQAQPPITAVLKAAQPLPVFQPLPAPLSAPFPAPLPAWAAEAAVAPLPQVTMPIAAPASWPVPIAAVATTPVMAPPAPSAPPAPPVPAAVTEAPTVIAAPAAEAASGPAPAATRAPELPPAASTPGAQGAPGAGSRLGADVATPPAAAASVPPRLNLQLVRPRGGELSRGGSGGMLPLLPRPPEVDEKLGRDIAKSAKQDCREAYRASGLLAVVPLVAQALKADSGCRW